MESNKLPFGTQFTPNVIDLRVLLELIQKHNNKEAVEEFIFDLKEKFCFSSNAIANNCKNSVVAYGLLKEGGGIYITEFAKELNEIEDDKCFYGRFAKHILKNLNGLMLIDVVRQLKRGGMRATNESIIEELNRRGFSYSLTANNPGTMRMWLAKAGVFDDKGWKINEQRIKELVDITEEEMQLFKELSLEQYYYLKTLCNIGSEEYFKAADIRELAKGTYKIRFPEKGFGVAILNPLIEKGFIEKDTAVSGNTPNIKLAEKSKKEIVIPYLKQVENLVGNELTKYYQKPLRELYEDINSQDTYIKGLALEAFTIRVMKIVGLDFVKTRLKGSEAAGAEVDIIFDSSQLIYSRWQVQCKNTSKVSLDQVAKEVGLSHVLKSNAIVIMTTGEVAINAREYANQIMNTTNLCIMFVEGGDIKAVLDNPVELANILNREALEAKQVKVLAI